MGSQDSEVTYWTVDGSDPALVEWAGMRRVCCDGHASAADRVSVVVEEMRSTPSSSFLLPHSCVALDPRAATIHRLTALPSKPPSQPLQMRLVRPTT